MTRTIVITGASDGVGAAAAGQLAAAGNNVVVVGRSPAKTRAVAERTGAVAHFCADFAELDQVRQLAADLRGRCERIDVLANNAGGLFSGPVATVDGFERTFQVNHLAPFLLTHELLDVLADSHASVVNTSSAASWAGHLKPDVWDPATRFLSFRAYGTAKLANQLFTAGLHRRYAARGLSAVAFHPGVVATSFGSGAGGLFDAFYRSALGRRTMITAEAGGANLAHFAAGTPGHDWLSGEYYDDHWRLARRPPQARDETVIAGLWNLSSELLGITG